MVPFKSLRKITNYLTRNVKSYDETKKRKKKYIYTNEKSNWLPNKRFFPELNLHFETERSPTAHVLNHQRVNKISRDCRSYTG